MTTIPPSHQEMVPFLTALQTKSASEIPTAEKAFHAAKVELARRGLENWTLFCDVGDLWDTEMREALVTLHGGEMPEWEPFIDTMSIGRTGMKRNDGLICEVEHHPFGTWWHKTAKVLILRFPTLEIGLCNPSFGRFAIVAAPEVGAFKKLMLDTRAEQVRRRKSAEVAEWRVVSSVGNWKINIDREEALSQPMLRSPELEAQLDLHVRGFFSDSWKALVKRNRIPYRRGVLLHGAPGNGKTSYIRQTLAGLPKVSAVFLQKSLKLDDDDLGTAITLWRESAPCVLVIEDLDSLFDRIPVSSFLNQIDGIRPLKEEGLLMIATTNHPEKLDPAINNRPGRFDAAIRFNNPDAALREAYFKTMLTQEEHGLLTPTDIRQLVRTCDGLSFSHLREVFLQAGMNAAKDGRTGRTPTDLLGAAQSVANLSKNAGEGFKLDSNGFGFNCAA